MLPPWARPARDALASSCLEEGEEDQEGAAHDNCLRREGLQGTARSRGSAPRVISRRKDGGEEGAGAQASRGVWDGQKVPLVQW